MNRPLILAATVAALVFTPSLEAANVYWDGTGTTWNSVTSWSTDSITPVPDPASIPGGLDLAIFNTTGVVLDQTVNLDDDQGALGLSVVSTGAVNILGGNANHVLLLNSNGITVDPGAGALNIGSTTDGQQVSVLLLDNQTWTNNSGGTSLSAINIYNDLGLGFAGPGTLTLGANTGTTLLNTIHGTISDGAGTLGLTMAGSASARWVLAAANTYSGVTTVAGGALRIKNGDALGSTTAGTVVASGGSLMLDAAGTITGESLEITGDGVTGSGGALLAISGVNRWTGDITVNTNTTFGRIGAVSGSTLTLDGNITATGTGQLVFQTGNTGGVTGTIIVNGDISHPGQRLTKSSIGAGSNVVILNGNNDYGDTTISSGIIQIGNGGTTGNLGTGNVSVGGTGGTLAFKRSDTISVPNTISGAGTIAHTGTGTVILTGANTHTGATSITGGGHLVLDFSGLATPTNIVGTGALTLTGSKLSLLGNSDATSSQTFSGTTLNAGHSAITVNSNDLAPINVSLGNLTRTVAGASLVVTLPSTGNVTTNATNTNDIIGGYLTIGDSNWAANDGAGNLVPLATYSNDLTGTGNLDVPAGGGVLDGAPNTIRFNNAAASTLTLPAARVVAAGGIMVTPNVGANLTEITGDFALTTGTGLDLVVFQNNTAGGLTIHSRIGSSFTKTGDGLVTLTGNSTASFRTRISAGTVSVGVPTNLGQQGGSDVISFPVGSTGVLQLTGNGTFASSKGITLTGNGTVEVLELATLTAPTSVAGPGNLTKTGPGTLVFSAAASTNSYTGATVIKEGVLQVNTLANGGTVSGIGASPSASENLVFNGGTLKYASASTPASTDRLFTVGVEGGIIDSSGGTGATLNFTNPGAIALSGSDTPRTLALIGTNIEENILRPILGDNGLGATTLQKAGLGSWTLAGQNTYSGGTLVEGGTLTAGANNAFGVGTVIVQSTAISLNIPTGVTNAIADTATLTLDGDGVLDAVAISGFAFLASGVNETVGNLILGGLPQTDFGGTYGATGSGATHIFDDYFQGPGVVTLVPEPTAAIALLSGLGVLMAAQRTRRRA